MRINNLPGTSGPLYLVYSSVHWKCLNFSQRTDKV